MTTIAERTYTAAPGWLQTLFLNAQALRIQAHRYGAPFVAQYEWLRGRERLPADQVRAYQNARVQAIVALAAARTTYYRNLFETHRIKPDLIRTVEDLQAIPLTEKDAIKRDLHGFLTRTRPGTGWLPGKTSGTTGSPLSVWYNRDLCILTNATDWRHKAWAGARPFTWFGVLLGRTIVPPSRKGGLLYRRNHVQKQMWLSSFHLDPEGLGRHVAALRNHGIRFLEGYPSTLYVLARYLLDRGETLPLAAVISSSETLHRIQREAIESAFCCRLFDFYASAERVVFAGECEAHQGKHIAEEFGYVELVDADGNRVPDGEPGYLVGTTLHNTAMPLLRYRLGDRTRIITEPCPCGRTLRRIADVATKAEDLVVTPDGRVISPSTLTHPFKPFSQILKSQLIQDATDHVIVKVVAEGGFSDDSRALLLANLRERLGIGMHLTLEVVDDIPRETSGKYRWVISKVPPPFRD